MIYAQVDVELRDHERITGAELADVPDEWRPAARAAMLGLFTWSLLYAQAKRSQEGIIPRAAVHGALNGAQERTAAHLVECGLFEAFTTHYRIRNYAEKNRTGEQIEEAIAANRERQARFRERRRLARESNGVTALSRVTPGSGSGSLSSSDLKIPEEIPSARAREDSGDGATVPATVQPQAGAAPDEPATSPSPEPMSATRLRAAPSPERVATPPPGDLPIDDDLVGRCMMAGYPRPTPAHVAACLARARARGLESYDWVGEVVLWMSRERQFASQRAPPPTPEVRPHTMSPPVKAQPTRAEPPPPDLLERAGLA